MITPWLVFTESINQYVDVKFESSRRIVCTFPGLTSNQSKSCEILYGECGQDFLMISRGISSSVNGSNVIIQYFLQPSESDYCYIIRASNGSFTVQTNGTFGKCTNLILLWHYPF